MRRARISTARLTGQLAVRRLQRLADIVRLARDARTPVGRLVIESVRQLLLDDRAFLLEHQQLLVTTTERERRIRLERPDHADLVEPDAERPSPTLVDAELAQGLAHIQVGLARGDDAEGAPLAVEHDTVESIGAREGLRGGQLEVDEPTLHRQREEIAAPTVETARRHLDIRPAGRSAPDRGPTSTVRVSSMVSVTALNPTQRPEKRDSAMPSRP